MRGGGAFPEDCPEFYLAFTNCILYSLNMTLLANMEREEHFCIQARIIPRVSIPPLGISDVNNFEKGHNEVITVVFPEELADEIRTLL